MIEAGTKFVGISPNVNMTEKKSNQLNDQTAIYTIEEIRQANYKVYSALLTQVDTDNPTAIVLEDTLGAELNWYYASTGDYYAESYGTWTTDKTAAIVGPLPDSSLGAFVKTHIDTEDQLHLVVFKNDGTETDNVLNNTFVEIRVYN